MDEETKAALALVARHYGTNVEAVAQLLEAAREAEVFGTNPRWFRTILKKRAKDAKASQENGKKSRGRPSCVDDDTLALYATELIFNQRADECIAHGAKTDIRRGVAKARASSDEEAEKFNKGLIGRARGKDPCEILNAWGDERINEET